MIELTVQLSLFVTAIVFLIIRLYTGKKRDFIIAGGFILLATIYSLINMSFSILWYFFFAMLFSFIGDLLMAQYIRITQHRTVDGAMAFGIAHIIYTVAFFTLVKGIFDFSKHFWIIILVVVLTIGLYKVIGYNEEIHIAYKISNFIYALLIISLFGTILLFIISPTAGILPKLTAFLGISLFMISDSVLAYNEFQKPIDNAKDIIAVTYILAQILLQLTPLLTII